MFQAGLWTYEDVENLAKLLLEKSENLITLESVCMRDSNSVLTAYPAFLRELETLFSDIKEYLCLIIIHMIVLVNDKSLTESLSWLKQGTGVFASEDAVWPNAYHKDRELNSILNNILMKYIVKDCSFKVVDKSFTYTRSPTRNLINNIFLMISDINYDAFELSKSHIDRRILDFRYKNFPGKESICQKAFEIKMNFINMIDDIVCGKFGAHDVLEQESKVDKIVTFMCKMLDDYLTDEADSNGQEQDDYYLRQLALADNNIPVLVLDVALILMDLEKKVPLRLLLSKLIKICKDNKVLQA